MPDRIGRLATRLALGAALVAMPTLFHVRFYRHFAHSKYYALWLLLVFAAVGMVMGRRRGVALGEAAWQSVRFRQCVVLVALAWSASLLVAVNVGHGLEFLSRNLPVLLIAWWVASQPLRWRKLTDWSVGLLVLTAAVSLFLGLIQSNEAYVWMTAQARPGAGDASAFWAMILKTMETLNREWSLLRNDRWLGSLGNPNSASSYYAASAILMFSVSVLLRRGWLWRGVAAVTGLVLVLYLLQTDSRSGLLGLAAGFLALGLVWVSVRASREHSPPRFVTGTLLAVALFTGLLGVLLLLFTDRGGAARLLIATSVVFHFIFLVETVMSRREGRKWLPPFTRKAATATLIAGMIMIITGLSLLAATDIEAVETADERIVGVWKGLAQVGKSTFIDRLCIWRSAGHMLIDNPLLGIGWGQFPVDYPLYTLQRYYHHWAADKLITTEEVHSGHYNIVLETGLLGGLAWGGLLALAWMGAMRRLRWAAAGDESARDVMIWFPLCVTLCVHMGVDKFLSYPASMTMLMWCLGQMVRPRNLSAVETRPAGAGWQLGGLSMLVGIVATLLATHMAVGSSMLAKGRFDFEEAKARQQRALQIRSSTDRATILADANVKMTNARTVLERACELIPWEIDSWTRSIDLETHVSRGAFSDKVIDFHRQAVRVAPNYYPIQRNMGTVLTLEYQRLLPRDPEAARERLEFAIEVYQQVLVMRPDEFNALFSLAELLERRNEEGDQDEAASLLQRYLAVPGIDGITPARATLARLRLSRHLQRMEDYQGAMEAIRSAIARGVQGREYPLWLNIAELQCAAGKADEALAELKDRLDTIDMRTVQNAVAVFETNQGRVDGLDQLWELVICRLAQGQAETAVQLAKLGLTANSNPEMWAAVAVVGAVSSEELAREVLREAEERWPGSPIIASAELALFGDTTRETPQETPSD
jgi:O-antigen ligase